MINGKAREKFCPRCGEDITDSYEPNEWITGGWWYCDSCELPIEAEDDGE